MISWILLLNPVIDLNQLKDGMIYFQNYLPWCLIVIGAWIQKKGKVKTR